MKSDMFWKEEECGGDLLSQKFPSMTPSSSSSFLFSPPSPLSDHLGKWDTQGTGREDRGGERDEKLGLEERESTEMDGNAWIPPFPSPSLQNWDKLPYSFHQQLYTQYLLFLAQFEVSLQLSFPDLLLQPTPPTSPFPPPIPFIPISPHFSSTEYSAPSCEKADDYSPKRLKVEGCYSSPFPLCPPNTAPPSLASPPSLPPSPPSSLPSPTSYGLHSPALSPSTSFRSHSLPPSLTSSPSSSPTLRRLTTPKELASVLLPPVTEIEEAVRTGVTSPRATNTVMELTKRPELLLLKQSEAARLMGISTSVLSKRWREATSGKKWPHRIHHKLIKGNESS